LALKLLDVLLELLQALVGGTQRLVLDDHRLRQEVRRIGLRTHLVGNESFGLAIARIVRVLPDAAEQVDQQLAFLGRHLSLHQLG
jgi:hypothetical protein